MVPGYFSPAYFAPAYFGGACVIPPPGAMPDPIPVVGGTVTDADCFRSILATLDGSGYFDQVTLGPVDPKAIGRGGACWLRPWRVAERRDSDVQVRIRTVRYRLACYAVADTIGDTPATLLVSDLAAAVADLIDRRPPPGCFAADSRILDGVYPDAADRSSGDPAPPWPAVGFALVGQFSYEIVAGQRSIGGLSG